MTITIFTFIGSVACAYMLGFSTVLAIVIWMFDRTGSDDSTHDNGDKVFLLRLIMWLPLIGAGLMAMRVIEELILVMEI